MPIELPGWGITIVQRREWGARPPTGPYRFHLPRLLVVHHSYRPSEEDYDHLGGEATVREIQRYHMEERGWIDIGYHFLIGPDGQVFEGRPPHVVGAHVRRRNTLKLGICLIGDFRNHPPSPEALQSLVGLVSWLRYLFGIGRHLYGHRDFVQTECPGDVLYAELPSVAQQAEELYRFILQGVS